MIRGCRALATRFETWHLRVWVVVRGVVYEFEFSKVFQRNCRRLFVIARRFVRRRAARAALATVRTRLSESFVGSGQVSFERSSGVSAAVRQSSGKFARSTGFKFAPLYMETWGCFFYFIISMKCAATVVSLFMWIESNRYLCLFIFNHLTFPIDHKS